MSEATEALLMEIKKRTEEEIQKILADAEKEAQRIIDEAKDKVDKLFMDKARSEVTLLRRKIVGRAEMEGRFEVLKAKEEAINKVIERALEEVKRIANGQRTDYNYEKILYYLIKEAVEGIGEQKVILMANSKDINYLKNNLKRLEEQLSQDLSMNVELVIDPNPIDATGGIIAKSDDGLKVYYNTLEGKVLKNKRKLRMIIRGILFS